MLAYAQTGFFPAFRRRARPSGVVLRLFCEPAMTRPTEVCEMDVLLGRVAARQDKAAFAALFGHFAPRVKAYLLRLGAPAAVAEELAQEALLNAWRKAHLFDPAKASAATWLFTIARNLRIDALRREKHPELDPEDLMPEPEAGADAAMMLAEKEGRLRLALKQLPDDQIQVVELSFFADKPHSQIAQELGIPLGTVKSRLRLAMARLKRAMGGEE
jgi:RNA polymerase sigma factor (sigma-70 family)